MPITQRKKSFVFLLLLLNDRGTRWRRGHIWWSGGFQAHIYTPAYGVGTDSIREPSSAHSIPPHHQATTIPSSHRSHRRSTTAGQMDRRISKEDGEAVKPTRSFRYEDYSTRRVFLRSYPLQWDWSPAQDDDDDDDKDGLSHAEAAAGNRADHADGDECCGGAGSRRWKRQVVAAVTEWGEDKLLLLRRAKKRLALYLIGCHNHGHGRRALPFPSAGGSCTVAMLTSR
ncbi:hypothetical protein BDA96_10G171200 [Sorghum bicolor]|uniref:Uncharacterized protein n=2 Tax=Sorghum bicolor TaxID=4558 RepID=A0A921U109_SORBI|nr:hypothetical protein BDA96_10G171200 [Sorghum bicolor]